MKHLCASSLVPATLLALAGCSAGNGPAKRLDASALASTRAYVVAAESAARCHRLAPMADGLEACVIGKLLHGAHVDDGGELQHPCGVGPTTLNSMQAAYEAAGLPNEIRLLRGKDCVHFDVASNKLASLYVYLTGKRQHWRPYTAFSGI